LKEIVNKERKKGKRVIVKGHSWREENIVGRK